MNITRKGSISILFFIILLSNISIVAKMHYEKELIYLKETQSLLFTFEWDSGVVEVELISPNGIFYSVDTKTDQISTVKEKNKVKYYVKDAEPGLWRVKYYVDIEQNFRYDVTKYKEEFYITKFVVGQPQTNGVVYGQLLFSGVANATYDYNIYIAPVNDQENKQIVQSGTGKSNIQTDLEFDMSNRLEGSFIVYGEIKYNFWEQNQQKMTSEVEIKYDFELSEDEIINTSSESDESNESDKTNTSNNNKTNSQELNVNEDEVTQKTNSLFDLDNNMIKIIWDDEMLKDEDVVEINVYDESNDIKIDEKQVQGSKNQCIINYDESISNIRIEINKIVDNISTDTEIVRVDIEEVKKNKIEFDLSDSNYFNRTVVPLNYTNGTEGKMFLNLNGIIEPHDIMESGAILLDLQPGENYLSIEVVTNEGIGYFTEKVLILDTKKPEIKFNGVLGVEPVTKNYIIIEGISEEADKISINGEMVYIDGEGYFKHKYNLEEGDNIIVIVATDKAGNVRSYNYTVTKVGSTEKIYFILGIIVTLIAVVLLIIKIRKNKMDLRQMSE